jgi:transcriptional regulator with XRE-family HTH domain
VRVPPGPIIVRRFRYVVSRAIRLERRYPGDMDRATASRLGRNIRQLRESRGLTQGEMAALAEIPRSTWASLESGAANPTLAVMSRVAHALQVSLEELVAAPRSDATLFPRGALPREVRSGVELRKLLPDPIPGMEIDRMELPAGSHMTGVPHTPGTREYLACEAGQVLLVASGERWTLGAGDVVAFRGDQRHSYHNPGARPAIAYSVVVLARVR